MELVDVYNERHELLGYTKGRKELINGEFRLSCFVWIINDKDEILIQQRVTTANKCPNMWGTTSGGAIAGDDAKCGVIRELNEELGIEINEEDLRFIGSYARVNDFVEVFLLKSNNYLNKLKFQKEEVQDAKWVSIKEFENMIKDGMCSDTSYVIFKYYYENFYNRYVVFENNKVVYKKINETKENTYEKV